LHPMCCRTCRQSIARRPMNVSKPCKR
jgi:hypothetical protein